MALDVEKYRLQSQNQSSRRKNTPVTKAKSRSLKDGFLKGPVPLNWLAAAAALPGKTLHVGIAIWLAYGVLKKRRFPFTPKWHQRFSIGPRALRQSLQRLQAANLVRIERRPGSSPIITLLDTPKATNSLVD